MIDMKGQTHVIRNEENLESMLTHEVMPTHLKDFKL
jgi:hypothetical protein